MADTASGTEAPGDGKTARRSEVLTLDGVSKTYGRGSGATQVLRDVTLSVSMGETVWLRGPSGSGKSSLLRVAGLLSRADTGRVLLDGQDMTHSDGADMRRRKIGFVFQHSNLLPDLTVAENVLVAGRNLTKVVVRERLAAFGLETIADRLAKQVSGGEAQRAALCRALINEPVLVLVDEPTSGLDAANADIVRTQLASLRSRGRAVLIASHDPLTDALADRVVDVREGRLV